MFEVRNYKEKDADRNWIYKNRGFYIGLGNR